MPLIDKEGTVIQGFVPLGRVGTFELIAGSVYKLRNFFGSRNKVQCQVADHITIVSFSWNSVIIPEDRFRFHSYEEFRANCDSKDDLYDYVGHMKLVNGQTITDHTVLDEADLAEKRHLCVHVQTHDGPVMKLYLWDKAATDFCHKFKSYGSTPSVFLVTTVNPKHIGGTLALTSMSSSRVFMDGDVSGGSIKNFNRSNSDIANRIAAEVVTKPESMTLEELFFYIKQEASKVAWFECTATIDDVVQGSAWYYISCGGCNSKAVKGPTSLICNNKKCGKSEVTGVAQYLTKISVYDKSEQAVFVILGDAAKELTGKHASELVASYFEIILDLLYIANNFSNEGAGADHCVPVPQALLDTIGPTRKFIMKVSDHNLQGKTQTIIVTKILPQEAPQPIAPEADPPHLEEDTIPATSDAILKTGSEESCPSRGFEDTVGDKVRKANENLGSVEAKRPKSG
ncbi:hypothetical protein Bca52824_033476 [Brassica carinata]|uniref:Replication factor A C-terminal domain-containing protein n=1 Tax=Brassica carinata TaxID=52824 RepID=A0A8X7SG47_BRACI|nr:hypothetical protein Bca52824_033476 [Brassica carinata]